jgi:hypothetical protein
MKGETALHGVVRAQLEDGVGGPVFGSTPHACPALDHQDPQAGLHEAVGDHGTAHPTPDDEGVVRSGLAREAV